MKDIFKNTITLEEAQQRCANWRAEFQQVFSEYKIQDEQILRGFHIPHDDILELASLSQFTGVRGYLAMKTPGDPSSIELLLVPVMHGKDILGEPNTGQSYIFDFTRPCPVQCDKTSDLYGKTSKGK